MPISVPMSDKYSNHDSESMISQLTSATSLTFADSLPTQLTRKTCKRGFTFNIMSVGPPGIGKTTLLSSLFNKNLDVPRKESKTAKDSTDFPIEVNTKTFDIEERGVKLRLSVVDCQNYGASLNLHNTYLPIVNYIEQQFDEYHKRESGYNRRDIQDTIVHCLFFFVSALGHGLNALDIQFLKSIHEKVNIVLIVAKADALNLKEKAAFKRRIKEDLENNQIIVYEIPDADPEDCEDVKRNIQEVKSAMPFAISSLSKVGENKLEVRKYEWGAIDLDDRDHSDYLLLKTMLHMNMFDLRDRTFEYFYEDYRVKMMATRQENISMRSFAASSIMTSSH